MPEPTHTHSTPATHAGHQPPGSPAGTSDVPASPAQPGQQPSAEQLPWGVGHKAQVIPDDTVIEQMPYLAECSCGTEGRFRTEDEAYLWINRHLVKYNQPPLEKTQAPAAGTAPQESHQARGQFQHRR